MSTPTKPRKNQPEPGQLYNAHDRSRMAALMCGLGVLFIAGFPFAGHIYARRLGKGGIAYLLSWFPILLLVVLLEETAPTVSASFSLLAVILAILMPFHSMSLVEAPQEQDEIEQPPPQVDSSPPPVASVEPDPKSELGTSS